MTKRKQVEVKVKRRKIRYDRLLLVVFIGTCLIGLLAFGTYKLVDHFINKPTPVEPNINLNVITVGPTKPSIEEFNEIMAPLVEEYEQKNNTIYLGEFLLTGYCNCEICCGQWSGGPCYNGEMPEAEWTIAVDPNVIPLNSYVWINGHRYKACDTGSAINENHIDIYCNSHEECFSDFCNGYADVYLEID